MTGLPLNSPLPKIRPSRPYTTMAISDEDPEPKAFYQASPPFVSQAPPQVAVLNTVNNIKKPAAGTKKSFKLPSLVLVGLEATGLVLLAFVGNYMGKLAYCEKNRQSVAGGIKAFDTLRTHYEALLDGIKRFDNESSSFPSQIEGGWLNHANQLTALVKAYCVNPKGFTGVRLANLPPDEIRQELYLYAKTALKYYQIMQNVPKQKEVAELLYDHRLSIPCEAKMNTIVAIKTFNDTDCKRRDFWDENVAHLILSDTSTDTEENTDAFTHKHWKTDFSEHVKTKMNKLPSKQEKEKLLERLNTYTAMMESLSVIEQLHEGNGNYTADTAMADFFFNHMHDLQPLDKSGDAVELTLILKAALVVMEQGDHYEKAWQIKDALNQLHKFIKDPNQNKDPVVKLKQFLLEDLGMTEVEGEQDDNDVRTKLPVTLFTWLQSQKGKLGRHPSDQVRLIEKLFDCVKNKKEENTPPLDPKQQLIEYYNNNFKKDNRALSLFIIKIWLELMQKYGDLEQTESEALSAMRQALGNSSYPAQAYRYRDVGGFFTHDGETLKNFVTSQTAPHSEVLSQ
jgi:hypothetical protein